MSMTLDQVEMLCRAFASSSFNEFEMTSAGYELRLCQSAKVLPLLPQPLASPSSVSAPIDEALRPHVIASPGIGRFLPSHPARPQERLRPGDQVRKEDIVAFLQIGLLLFPVSSGCDGVVESLVAEPYALVDYAAPLFNISEQRNSR